MVALVGTSGEETHSGDGTALAPRALWLAQPAVFMTRWLLWRVASVMDCCHDERQKLRGMEVLALDQKDAGAGGQKKSGKKRKGTAVKKAPDVP